MNEIDKKLYEYLGDKTYSPGCLVIGYPNKGKDGGKMIVLDDNLVGEYCGQYAMDYFHNRDPRLDDIIGHKPTITDLHKWFNSEQELDFVQNSSRITVYVPSREGETFIWYDSNLPLMEQGVATKEAIIQLIEEYGNNLMTYLSELENEQTKRRL